MRKNKQQFNILLIRYNKYLRKRRNLISANRNRRRQTILSKHIERLYEKLIGLKLLIQRASSVALVTSALAVGVDGVQAQKFCPLQTNVFGLTAHGIGSNLPSVVDIDNDGDLEIFITVAGQFLYYENVGTTNSPAYGTPVINPFSLTGIIGGKHTFVDLDNDGDFDLFYANNLLENFTYYENIGTATIPVFGAAQSNPFSLTFIKSFPSPAFADLDKDGDFDLMVGKYDGNFGYFENTGTKSAPVFAPAQANPFGIVRNRLYYSTIDLVDLDGDGDFDLLTGHGNSSRSGFFYQENEGTSANPSFGRQQYNPFSLTSIPVGYSKPVFGDFDGDGDFDLLSPGFFGDFYYYENLEKGIPKAPTDTRPSADKTVCKNQIAQLSVSGTGTIGWYDAAIGGNWLAGGNTYITNALNASTTFYVQDSTFSGASVKRTAIVVNIETINTTISVSGATINSVNQRLALYQWLDCNNSKMPISGETNDSFTAKVNGDYAVAISIAGCTDTSACTYISSTGINNHLFASKIKMYPNPTQDEVRFDLGDLKNVQISITNSVGMEIYNSNRLLQNRIVISLSAYGKGIYFVKLTGINEYRMIKLIKY